MDRNAPRPCGLLRADLVRHHPFSNHVSKLLTQTSCACRNRPQLGQDTHFFTMSNNSGTRRRQAEAFHHTHNETVFSFRSEEHTSELHSLMRISYAVFCLKKKNIQQITQQNHLQTTSNN